jgi:hypothetical protein
VDKIGDNWRNPLLQILFSNGLTGEPRPERPRPGTEVAAGRESRTGGHGAAGVADLGTVFLSTGGGVVLRQPLARSTRLAIGQGRRGSRHHPPRRPAHF